LFIDETTTEIVRQALTDDPDVVIWTLTQVELVSAIWRRQPEPIAGRARSAAKALMAAAEWVKIAFLRPVTANALGACERHRLRSGDALQLAAALVACKGKPSLLPFVTLDTDLASAARAEGFPVLP
jgi:hypothetical protein